MSMTNFHQIQCFWNSLFEASSKANQIEEKDKTIILCSRLFEDLSVNHSGCNQLMINSIFKDESNNLDTLSQILFSLEKKGFNIIIITENSDGTKWELGVNKAYDDEHNMFGNLKLNNNTDILWNRDDISTSYVQTPLALLMYDFNTTQIAFDRTIKQLHMYRKELDLEKYIHHTEKLKSIHSNSYQYGNKISKMEEVITVSLESKNVNNDHHSSMLNQELSPTLNKDDPTELTPLNFETPKNIDEQYQKIMIKGDTQFKLFQEIIVELISNEKIELLDPDQIRIELNESIMPCSISQTESYENRLIPLLNKDVTKQEIGRKLYTNDTTKIADCIKKIKKQMNRFKNFISEDLKDLVNRMMLFKKIKDSNISLKNKM